MKIFMLADGMNVGGAETHILELSRLFASRGHEVIVFSSGGVTARRLEALGVTHVPLPDELSPRVLASLADHIRREKPHVIHAHTRRRAFLCRLLLCGMDLPLVFTAHAAFSPRFPQNRLSYFPADTIAVSRDIAAHLVRAFGVPPDHLRVIGNGVDTARFRPRHSHTNAFTILTVGRQDEDSSLAATLLCRIAPRLARSVGRPIRIVVAGGGAALPRLRALAEEANRAARAPIVTLLGNCADTAPLFEACDLFVGVSRAAMEALASGCPVILCGNEGYPGPLTPEKLAHARRTNLCGRGEETPRAEALFRDLADMVSRPEDERLHLGAWGRKVALRYFSAEQMADETLAVYETARARFRASRTTDALLCGYYGYGNCGDEWILRSIVSAQKARCASLRMGVMSADGSAPQGTVGIPRYSAPAVLSALRKSGALILGGGSLLQDVTSFRSLLYYTSLIRAAHAFAVPVMLYANGLGPLSPRGTALCHAALASVDLISVRDGESFAALRRMGIPPSRLLLGADPVLGEDAPDETRDALQAPPRPRLVLLPKGGATSHAQRELSQAVAALSRTLALDVVVSVMNPREDEGAARDLVDQLTALLRDTPRHATLASFHPRALRRLVARSSLVVSGRLHGLILAFSSGIPSVGLDGDPKIGAFLREIGRPNCLCKEISPQSLLFCAKSAMDAPPDRETRNALRARADRDAEYAFRLITGDPRPV